MELASSRVLRVFYLFIIFISSHIVTGCSQLKEEAPVNQALLDGIEQRRNDPANLRAVDSSLALLKNGDVVVRTGNDITSYMLCQLNQKDKTYSHCGVVMMEHGYPFVYHSIGGEANPDARIRRDSASCWFSPADNLGFGIARFDMTDSTISSLGGIVRQIYRERRKFDMDFDLATDDRLYCAEFVYKAVNHATANNTYITPVTYFGHSFVGIDNIFLSPHARAICQIRFK
ncbi:MAG: hypothetical protein EOP56_03270 [Sphingobacteriales bacterium]|nr:MAG: hypothetical protein EOP56_03270 [Sphingobacteriales bacterium]